MRRRDFVSLIGGSAVVWPLVARAQQGERMRRVGVLESLSEDPYLAAFLQGLQQLGWADGHNVRIDTRWGAGNADDIRKYAAELAALAPDVMLAAGTSSRGAVVAGDAAPCRSCSCGVTDPVGAGFVDSLARPGGNATGFHAVRIQLEREMAGAAQDRSRRA